MISKLLKKIITRVNTRRIGELRVGSSVEFVNNGTIESGVAYIGSIENASCKIANKSSRSFFRNTGSVKLGSNVRIHKGLGVDVSGELEVRDNTYINPDCIIVCRERISIGENCAIGWNVTIMDSDLHTPPSSSSCSQIKIGNHVWIGANAFIAKGVQIGDNSIVAANSVVTSDLPNKCLAGGVPAKVIKENVEWT